MKLNRKAMVVAFVVTLGVWAIAWAITIDQIWNNVYDASNTALRTNQVAGI
jgi:hypothetical protein